MEGKKPPKQLSTTELFTKSSVMAAIIAIPSLAGFGIGWYILDDLIPSAIIGVIIHFIVLAFSFRISKRLFDKSQKTEDV
ncbi:MAG TPA: hypothetical protein VFG25_08155 [Nitrosopumilaceae archaeon]|nr:hypothetical protein [Nitrosopumilaceae archaeon]